MSKKKYYLTIASILFIVSLISGPVLSAPGNLYFLDNFNSLDNWGSYVSGSNNISILNGSAHFNGSGSYSLALVHNLDPTIEGYFTFRISLMIPYNVSFNNWSIVNIYRAYDPIIWIGIQDMGPDLYSLNVNGFYDLISINNNTWVNLEIITDPINSLFNVSLGSWTSDNFSLGSPIFDLIILGSYQFPDQYSDPIFGEIYLDNLYIYVDNTGIITPGPAPSFVDFTYLVAGMVGGSLIFIILLISVVYHINKNRRFT